MMPRRNIGSLPKVGLELEVVRWEKTKNPEDQTPRKGVVKELMSAGLMETDMEGANSFADQVHQYNCKCSVCIRWVKWDTSPYPVQFTLEYDGSLPYYSGGEFITSPFPVEQAYLESFWHGYEIITNTAVRELKYPAKNGGLAVPSIHVHASCWNPENYNPDLANDFKKAYAPEIFVLALSCGLDRGMKYRHLDSNAMTKGHDYNHHSYMNVQNMTISNKDVQKFKETYPNVQANTTWGGFIAGPHIELRTWEADYSNLPYIHGAIHFSAALAQLMSSAPLLNKLVGYTMLNRPRDTTVLPEESADDVIALVDKKLFMVLRKAVLNATYLHEWDYAYNVVDEMFDLTEELVLNTREGGFA